MKDSLKVLSKITIWHHQVYKLRVITKTIVDFRLNGLAALKSLNIHREIKVGLDV